MMNIETLLQAAQILESQQSIPPKKRLARVDRQTSNSHVPTSVLAPTTTNTHPTVPSVSSMKTDHADEYPQRDLNLNQHHHTHRAQQRLSLDQNDDDDDDDDDDVDVTNNQNVIGNGDGSNRGQATCIRDREIHNRLEKHRRAHLKECFDSLKAEVPCQRDRKITNLQVLNLAIKYIQTLARKERDYDQEIAQLTSRQAELQQRLGCLKSELNTEGHDVNTWLDSCSDIDHSVSTQTASEAEMYRSFDDDHDELEPSPHASTKKLADFQDLPTHQASRPTSNTSYSIDRKPTTATRQRPRPSKRKLQSIPTTNLLQTLSTSTPVLANGSCSESLLDHGGVRHRRLDEPCNLLTQLQPRIKDTSSSSSITPFTDIRYEIVDMFTKGTTSHLQQPPQQISPLPSIASLMNRHSSPVVSPTKQTIGINTDPLTTSTTNILHQPVATS